MSNVLPLEKRKASVRDSTSFHLDTSLPWWNWSVRDWFHRKWIRLIFPRVKDSVPQARRRYRPEPSYPLYVIYFADAQLQDFAALNKAALHMMAAVWNNLSDSNVWMSLCLLKAWGWTVSTPFQHPWFFSCYPSLLLIYLWCYSNWLKSRGSGRQRILSFCTAL